MIVRDGGQQYGQRHPDGAYPTLVFSSHGHITPDRVRVETSEAALYLWIDGASISVDRRDDDTRLAAALDVAWTLSQACERFGSLVRAELEARERQRAAEQAAAAHRAAEHQHEHPHPYPEPEPVAEATRPIQIAGPA